MVLMDYFEGFNLDHLTCNIMPRPAFYQTETGTASKGMRTLDLLRKTLGCPFADMNHVAKPEGCVP